MKLKIKYLFVLMLMTFLGTIGNVRAVNITSDELGDTIESIKPDASFAYIIGKYVYTDEMVMSTKDIMLGTLSIDLTDKDGKTNKDSIYNEMRILYAEWVGTDAEGHSKWNIKNYIGSGDIPTSYDLRYVDYQEVKEAIKYTVTFDNDGTTNSVMVREGKVVDKPTAPTKEGYKFIGWYNGEEAYDFTSPVTSDLTLIAKYMPYDVSLIEAENRTYAVGSGIIQTHEVFKTSNNSLDNNLLVKFSELTNMVYIQMRTLTTGEESSEEIQEAYQVVKDNKTYFYYKIIDEETQEEIWYYNIGPLDNSESSTTNYKSIQKITSDIDGQDKYQFTLDKNEYIYDNNLQNDFVSDIVGYAYVKDGYLIKTFIDYRESLSEVDKSVCDEYTSTIIYSGLNENDDFTIPQEIIDKAILVE